MAHALLSCFLLVVSVYVASAAVPDTGYTGVYVPFKPKQLEDLYRSIGHAINKGSFLAQRLSMLKTQKEELMTSLDGVESDLGDLQTTSSQQDTRLDLIAQSVKDRLHRLLDLDAALAEEIARNNRVQVRVGVNKDLIHDIEAGNVKQEALLTETKSTLEFAKEKLTKTLEQSEDSSERQIEEVVEKTKDFIEYVNRKKCVCVEVECEVDQATGESTHCSADLGNVFGNLVPDVFCGMCGINASINSVNPHAGNPHLGEYEEREASGVSIDCKATDSSTVELKVMDHSHGAGSFITNACVEVIACSHGALSGW